MRQRVARRAARSTRRLRVRGEHAEEHGQHGMLAEAISRPLHCHCSCSGERPLVAKASHAPWVPAAPRPQPGSRRARMPRARTSARAGGRTAAMRARAQTTPRARAVERRPLAPTEATSLSPVHIYNSHSRGQHMSRQASRRGSRVPKRTYELVEADKSVETSRPEGQTHGEWPASDEVCERHNWHMFETQKSVRVTQMVGWWVCETQTENGVHVLRASLSLTHETCICTCGHVA